MTSLVIYLTCVALNLAVGILLVSARVVEIVWVDEGKYPRWLDPVVWFGFYSGVHWILLYRLLTRGTIH